MFYRYGFERKDITAAERKFLATIAERIFPQTDTSGALEIGALDYIEIALAGE